MHRITPSQSGFRAYSGGGRRFVLDEVNDKSNMQEMKGIGLTGESFDNLEAPQNYGFTSHNWKATKNKNGEIIDGAEGYGNFAGGNSSHGSLGNIDDRRHRLREIDEGDTAMFRGKDDRQQFHMNGKGTYLSTRNDKKMRIALVPDQRQQSGQQPQATTTAAAGGASSGGQQQQQQQKKGQTPAKDDNEKSDTFIEQTKSHNHIRRGNGNVKTEDGQTQTYHGSDAFSTRCDAKHVHIRAAADKIWVAPGGCFATKPIEIVDCGDGGTTASSGATRAASGRYADNLHFAPEALASNAQAPIRVRFWFVRHLGSMGIDNCHVDDMDFTALPAHVEVVEWKEGFGEIEYDDRPRLREVTTDVTSFAPFFDQFIAKLPNITLAQAKKIKIDLIGLLYENKRQLPYAYNIAAGNFTWDATDGAVAGMTLATIPSIISNLTGTSDSTVVGKINTLADQINANIVNPGNQLKGEINNFVVNPGNQNKDAGNALVAEINSSIMSPIYNGFDSINTVFGAVNSNIVTPANSLAYHLDNVVIGYAGDRSTNTISDRLRQFEQTAGMGDYVAAPGLASGIAVSGVGFTAVGSNPHQVTALVGAFPTSFSVMTATFVAVSHASTTPDPTIPAITWPPIGQANPVTLTAVEMQGLMSGISSRQKSLMTTRFNKAAAVNALTTIAAVIAYDVTTGWPA